MVTVTEINALLSRPDQTKQSIQDGYGIWGAAGDIKIDRQLRFGAIVDFGMINERAAGNRAGADRDDKLRIGDRFIRLLQCRHHVPADAAGNQNSVGVTRRCNKLNAESAEIENDGIQHVHVRFAGVAAGGAHLAQFERSAEDPARFLLEPSQAQSRLPFRIKSFLLPHGKAIIGGVTDRLPADTRGRTPRRIGTCPYQVIMPSEPRRMASVGHASMQRRQSEEQSDRLNCGRPRNLSGRAGSLSGKGNGALFLTDIAPHSTLSMVHPQKIVSAIRQVKALVAEREIGNLLASQRDRQSEPVVE